MRKPIVLVLSVAALCALQAQTRPTPHEWSVTLKVLDDRGMPVPGALAWVSYNLPQGPDQTKNWEQIRGLTDTNGVFTASHRDQSVTLGFHAEKEGYYPTGVQHFLGFEAESKPANWHPKMDLTLERIGTPVQM